jgi:putative redox protein
LWTYYPIHTLRNEETAVTPESSAGLPCQEGPHFVSTDHLDYTVQLDTMAAPGGSTAPTPMELLMSDLAGWSAMEVITILRKKRQPIEHLEVRIRSRCHEQHPTVFAIELEYIIRGASVDPLAAARVIDLARDRYRLAWARFGPSALPRSTFRITSAEPVLAPLN